MKFHVKLWTLTPVIVLFLLVKNTSGQLERTELDKYIPFLRIFREAAMGFIGKSSQNSRNLNLASNANKLQRLVSTLTPFPCTTTGMRSQKRPKSVHTLRLGDIDVVGAIGDSLTAGNGLTATNILQVFIENRGISWSIGGQSNWREYLTLPNILKEFNPKLIGFSLGDSLTIHKASQFNVGEAGAVSGNTPYMAKILVRRITQDKRVNLKEDWKMITYMIGPNDFCSEMCYQSYPEKIIDKHRQDVIQVLRTLRNNLPRTIVNLVPSPNLKILASFNNKPSHCHITHSMECPCIFGLAYKHMQARFEKLMVKWQQTDMEVANYPEFDRDDFTVVLQPFTTDYRFPTDSRGRTDYSYLSEDCFHLSQKGNARVANALWNNILEPVGKKMKDGPDLFKRFLCPSENKPYIYTKRNSFYGHGSGNSTVNH